jgi:hypothetical protein
MPAVKLSVKQQLVVSGRQDKTGSRTFPGVPAGGRKQTSFALNTYLTSWQKTSPGPSYGPLFQAALGGTPAQSGGGAVSAATTGRASGLLRTARAFGWTGSGVGQRVAICRLHCGRQQRSVERAVHRLAGGRRSDAGDCHLHARDHAAERHYIRLLGPGDGGAESDKRGGSRRDGDPGQRGLPRIQFGGLAQDVLDSSSFSTGAASLQTFPAEPALAAFDYSIVPGNLGQAWLGTTASQFFTVTNASIVLKNNLETRAREFGSSLPLAISPGRRVVAAALELYSQDDAATEGLYQAARQQSPISRDAPIRQCFGTDDGCVSAERDSRRAGVRR